MAAIIERGRKDTANPVRAPSGVTAALLALAIAGGASCRDQQSFVVVTVESAEDTPITGVVDFVVVVGNGRQLDPADVHGAGRTRAR